MKADQLPPATDERAIVLFDGVCNLCEGVVRFIAPRDPGGHFRFAALQSEAGKKLLARHGLPTDDFDTFVLLEGSRCFTGSDAFVAVTRRLRGGWRWLALLRLVPRPLRDWAYRVVVRNRYRWFGKKDACLIPTPELRARFLDEEV